MRVEGARLGARLRKEREMARGKERKMDKLS